MLIISDDPTVIEFCKIYNITIVDNLHKAMNSVQPLNKIVIVDTTTMIRMLGDVAELWPIEKTKFFTLSNVTPCPELLRAIKFFGHVSKPLTIKMITELLNLEISSD